jgi:hypothetical protein
MAPWHYTLRIGHSATGDSLHPSEADPEEGFRFPDLDYAKDEAERLCARRLRWRHNPAVQIWTAVVGDGRVAEITQGTMPQFSVSVGTMP